MVRRPKTPCPDCIYGVKRCERHRCTFNPHASTRLRLTREKAAEVHYISESGDRKSKRERASSLPEDLIEDNAVAVSSDDSDDYNTRSPPAKRARLDQQVDHARNKSSGTRPSALKSAKQSSKSLRLPSTKSKERDSKTKHAGPVIGSTSNVQGTQTTTSRQVYDPESPSHFPYNPSPTTRKQHQAELEVFVDIKLKHKLDSAAATELSVQPKSSKPPPRDTTNATAAQSSVETKKTKRKRERQEQKERAKQAAVDQSGNSSSSSESESFVADRDESSTTIKPSKLPQKTSPVQLASQSLPDPRFVQYRNAVRQLEASAAQTARGVFAPHLLELVARFETEAQSGQARSIAVRTTLFGDVLRYGIGIMDILAL
jgi:hypothetical protein